MKFTLNEQQGVCFVPNSLWAQKRTQIKCSPIRILVWFGSKLSIYISIAYIVLSITCKFTNQNFFAEEISFHRKLSKKQWRDDFAAIEFMMFFAFVLANLVFSLFNEKFVPLVESKNPVNWVKVTLTTEFHNNLFFSRENTQKTMFRFIQE